MRVTHNPIDGAFHLLYTEFTYRVGEYDIFMLFPSTMANSPLQDMLFDNSL